MDIIIRMNILKNKFIITIFVVFLILLLSNRNVSNPIETSYQSLPKVESNNKKVEVKIMKRNLDKLIKVLIRIESNGNVNAVNKITGASGCLQILPIMVEEVNRISKIKKYNLKFEWDDVWDLQKSIMMFKIYTNFYSKNESYEVISKRWNGGPTGEMKQSTEDYWNRVQRYLYK